MQTNNRSLLALALCAAFAAPSFTSAQVSLPRTPTPVAVPAPAVKAPPVTTTKPTEASDAVSAKATARESGRMMESPVKAGTTIGVNAKASPGRGNWWAEADIDGDGKLSAAEAKSQAGLDARFGDVDADADGYVTNEEYRKFFTSAQSQGEVHASAHSAVVTRSLWGKLDANSDGKLSSGEVSSNTTISGAFSVMDSNGDGFVTQAEYTAYAKANLKK
jgi:Ca2+-binding EF-hand superfamily protein